MVRRKPADPGAAARLAQDRKDREAEIARLIAMGATVTLDPGRRLVSARLSNAYNLMLQRKAITASQYDAAYNLAELWAVWKGLDGKPEGNAEFVDNGRSAPDKRCLVTNRMIVAGKAVNTILDKLYPDNRRLTVAFMVATVEEDRSMAWRGIMEREGVQPGSITIDGERKDRQTVAFVRALEALRRLFQEPQTQHRVAA
jgi:hypothetical protein